MATEETPTIEEPTEPSASKESADDQAAAILDELKTLGIDSPEKVQGMATASSEAGNLARMVGELRQEVQSLRQAPAPDPAPVADDGYGEAVDIKGLIRSELRGFYQNEIIKPQVEQTNRVYGELSQIQNDSDFSLVESVWGKHWNSPQTQHRVMTGQTTPVGEYNKVVRTYYREALKKTHGALKGVMETKAKPPHVEVGDQTHVYMPTATEETKEVVKKITESSQGSDQDIEALVKAILPANDPIFGR